MGHAAELVVLEDAASTDEEDDTLAVDYASYVALVACKFLSFLLRNQFFYHRSVNYSHVSAYD